MLFILTIGDIIIGPGQAGLSREMERFIIPTASAPPFGVELEPKTDRLSLLFRGDELTAASFFNPADHFIILSYIFLFRLQSIFKLFRVRHASDIIAGFQ